MRFLVFGMLVPGLWGLLTSLALGHAVASNLRISVLSAYIPGLLPALCAAALDRYLVTLDLGERVAAVATLGGLLTMLSSVILSSMFGDRAVAEFTPNVVAVTGFAGASCAVCTLLFAMTEVVRARRN
jgi:mannitol-specific phosphotransferase system IIBC component